MAAYQLLSIFLLTILIITITGVAGDADGNKDPSVICKLPKETGICRGFKKHWAFNAEKGHCEEFVYGGCRGNANNFVTEAECKSVCAGQT